MSTQKGPIPKGWRLAVVAILQTGLDSQILIRRRALKDWQATFPGEFFDYTLRDALAAALENESMAGKRYEMDEPGETYGFIFQHCGVLIYGKVNLTEPDKLVIIYSAHPPLNGPELQ